MKATLQKYLLFCFMLLLSGYTKSYAHRISTTKVLSSSLFLKTSPHANYERMEVWNPVITSEAILLKIQKKLFAEAVEEQKKEEVLLSTDKKLVFGGLATIIFYALGLGYFLRNLENNVASYKFCVFTPFCKRYIKFQVFRI